MSSAPPVFHELPPVLTAFASILVVVIAGVLTRMGLNKPPAPTPAPAVATDTVVVSGAFADAKPMRDLNSRLADLDATLASLNRCTRLHAEEQERTTDATSRLAGHVHELKELLEVRLPRAR